MMKLNQFIILISFNFLFCGLLKPLNGDNLLNYIHIYFEWDQEPNASKYQLQVSNQIVFDNLILDLEENSTAYIDKEHFDWKLTTIGELGQFMKIIRMVIGLGLHTLEQKKKFCLI